MNTIPDTLTSVTLHNSIFQQINNAKKTLPTSFFDESVLIYMLVWTLKSGSFSHHVIDVHHVDSFVG
jgi:hypothetical protein